VPVAAERCLADTDYRQNAAGDRGNCFFAPPPFFFFKLWEFLTELSAKTSRRKIKPNQCTVGLQLLFQRNNNTTNFPIFSEKGLPQFKKAS